MSLKELSEKESKKELSSKIATIVEMKDNLRTDMRQLRKEFRAQNPKADEQLALNLINKIKSLKSGGIWVGYKAIGSEANPEQAINTLGGQWAYPRMRDSTLDFYLTTNDSSWDVGPSGIPEPSPQTSQQIDIHSAEGVLVPGLVFDRSGNRLGSGRAFYDKALAGFQGHKIGLAYSVQIQGKELPTEEHDIRMDFIVSESENSEVKGK